MEQSPTPPYRDPYESELRNWLASMEPNDGVEIYVVPHFVDAKDCAVYLQSSVRVPEELRAVRVKAALLHQRNARTTLPEHLQDGVFDFVFGLVESLTSERAAEVVDYLCARVRAKRRQWEPPIKVGINRLSPDGCVFEQLNMEGILDADMEVRLRAALTPPAGSQSPG